MVSIKDIVRPLVARMTAARKFRNFPGDYLVVDIETSGVECGLDLIVQLGHSAVLGGKEVDRVATVLDWTRVPSIDQQWLRDRMVRVKRHVEFDKTGKPTGKRYHLSYERMVDEGVDPFSVLRVYRQWFEQSRADGLFFVGHNGYKFDRPFLHDAFARFLGDPFQFDALEMVDTGMIEKALRASEVPRPEESPAAFYDRLGRMMLKGVKWALDAFAIPRHGLDVKHALDMNAAHSADFDCYMCHLLFQHYLENSFHELEDVSGG